MAQNGDATVSADGLRPGSVTPNLPKKLIICCDGTWKDRDNKPNTPTNISRLARAMRNEDEKHYQQIVYYQAGVGTGTGFFNDLIGGGTGLGLAEHIREAYSFLTSNYSELNSSTLPDSIFLVGFSRGAFTARSIGGLLGAIGLLTKKAMPFFHDIFEDWQNAGSKQPRFFDRYFEDPEERKRYEPSKELALAKGAENIDIYLDKDRQSLIECGLTQVVKIKCIGVFDTVGSLGIPVHPMVQRIIPFLPASLRPYSWFDTRIGDHVENGFHALALDERRAPYHPTLWELRPNDNSYIKQVWFPGAHSNVGGGYDETGISDLTITWMMDHLSGKKGSSDRNLGPEHWIQFDEKYVEEYYAKRRLHYMRQMREGQAVTPWREWACGAIQDSFRFPHTLLGQRVRTPGRYHFTNYVTGREDPDKLLTRTNEYVHASVRERIHKGGNAPEPKPRSFPLSLLTEIKRAWYALTGKLRGGRSWPRYKPMERGQPLQEWKLHDGHDEHDSLHRDAEVEVAGTKAPTWKYLGNEQGPPLLLEDDLGYYQRKLLMLDTEPESVNVDQHGWVQDMATRARRGLRRPGTF